MWWEEWRECNWRHNQAAGSARKCFEMINLNSRYLQPQCSFLFHPKPISAGPERCHSKISSRKNVHGINTPILKTKERIGAAPCKVAYSQCSPISYFYYLRQVMKSQQIEDYAHKQKSHFKHTILCTTKLIKDNITFVKWEVIEERQWVKAEKIVKKRDCL